jgi:prepilin-type N-terminal cleavage/methylation domain-containing protein
MHRTAKGFTLIELITVIAIMSIMATIGTLIVVSALPSYSLSRAAREMVSNFRKARTLAIKLNTNVALEFDAANNKYIVNGRPFPEFENLNEHYGGGVRIGFPGRTTAVTFADSKVTFNSLGISRDVGYVFLQNRNSTKENKVGYRIGIRGMGNIVMEKCGQKDSAGTVITCLE